MRPRSRRPFPRLTYSEAVELLTSDTTQNLLDAEEAGLEDQKADLERERDANKARYGSVKAGEKRRLDARDIEIGNRLADIDETLRYLPEWKKSAAEFEWGADLGGSDETVLTRHFDTPIIVHRYPAAVKAFYMKRDPEDDRLALGMDVLAPEGYGEIVGGGERATDLDFLKAQVAAHGLPRVCVRLVLRPAALRVGPALRLRPRPRADGRVRLRPAARPRDGPVPAPPRPAAPVIDGRGEGLKPRRRSVPFPSTHHSRPCVSSLLRSLRSSPSPLSPSPCLRPRRPASSPSRARAS